MTDDEEWEKEVRVSVEEECKLENPEGEIYWLVWVYENCMRIWYWIWNWVNEGIRDGLNEAFSGVVEDRNKVVWVSFYHLEMKWNYELFYLFLIE